MKIKDLKSKEGFKIFDVIVKAEGSEGEKKKSKTKEFKINELLTPLEWKDLKRILDFTYSLEEKEGIEYSSDFKTLENLYNKNPKEDLKEFILIGIKRLKEM